jgi:hypothetical protein
MARVRGSHAAARRHSSPLGLVVAALPRFVRWGLWSLCPRKVIVSNPPTRTSVQPSHAYRRTASRVVPGFSLSRTGWTLQRRERFRVHVQQPGALGVVPDTSRVAPGQDGAHELDLDDPPQCD